MSTIVAPPTPPPPQPAPPRVMARYVRRPASVLAHGEPMLWLTGGALAICLVMILGLLGIIVWNGSVTFWPGPIYEVKTVTGQKFMGEEFRSEWYRPGSFVIDALPEQDRPRALAMLEENGGETERRLLRTANFDLTGTHFTWVSDIEIAPDGMSRPKWAVLVERITWGRFYGFPKSISVDGVVTDDSPEAVWREYEARHDEVRALWHRRRALEAHEIGRVNRLMEASRLRLREAELRMQPPVRWSAAFRHLLQVRNGGSPEQIAEAEADLRALEEAGDRPSPEFMAAVSIFEKEQAEGRRQFEEIAIQIAELRRRMDRYQMTLAAVDGQEKTLGLAEIVRAFPANQLSLGQRVQVYLSRWWEFLSADPREANSEGGIFPAIFGTVTMTLLMSLAVVPFGVLAALYLREYAKGGPIVSAVRIAVNNLAGVPSIVFGVFGLGFFSYGIGKWVDGGSPTPWTPGFWLAAVVVMLAVIALAVTLSVIASRARRDSSSFVRNAGRFAVATWLAAVALFLGVLFNSPHFGGFYAANLPSPTFGTGGLMWASLTLALLTLPVVIVATEEALAAVPSSMRDGSYACGASKWQTIVRIVLPRAMPGIMTGMILAMARGAGEVAPLMLVGAVKLAPELPIDIHNWSGTLGPIPTGPIHLERSFMHLGFHIYDLGFQSQNSEAAKPMVFTTAFVLILLITALNLAAIALRTRLRRKFIASAF